jgi:hypothetical protein
MVIRASIDRRNGSDRRKAYKLGYFMAGGIERRGGYDRRSGEDRRMVMRSAFPVSGLTPCLDPVYGSDGWQFDY